MIAGDQQALGAPLPDRQDLRRDLVRGEFPVSPLPFAGWRVFARTGAHDVAGA